MGITRIIYMQLYIKKGNVFNTQLLPICSGHTGEPTLKPNDISDPGLEWALQSPAWVTVEPGRKKKKKEEDVRRWAKNLWPCRPHQMWLWVRRWWTKGDSCACECHGCNGRIPESRRIEFIERTDARWHFGLVQGLNINASKHVICCSLLYHIYQITRELAGTVQIKSEITVNEEFGNSAEDAGSFSKEYLIIM